MTTETFVPTSNALVHVLVVASDPWQSQCIDMALADRREAGFDICRREQISEAAESLASCSFDIVVLHLPPGNKSFLEVVADLRRHAGATPLVVIAGSEEEALAIQAVEQGADEYLLEGEIGGDALTRTLRHLVERRKLRAEHGQLRSEFAEIEGQLKLQTQRLVESREASNRMLGGLSHEFRTPLTVVQEYCALVRDGLAGPVSEEQCRYLDIATDRVGDLNRMLNDFVDSAALESGAHRLRRKPARLVEVVDRLRPGLLAKAAIRQARIETWVSADLPQVFCDADIVSRVICNLVAQALKAARSEGSVRIWAERAADQRQVVIAVGDNCLGVTPDDPELFLRTYALATDESAATLTRGIFSLGMAQTLARANFGEFRVHRDPLRGTTYFFTLPEVDPEAVMASYIRERNRSADGPSSVALVLVSLDVEAGVAAADLLDDVLFDAVAQGDLILRLEPFVWALIVDATWQQAQLAVGRVQEAWLKTNRSKRIKRPPEILGEVKAIYHINSQDRETPMPIDAPPLPPTPAVFEKSRILLVDDDRSIVEALRLRLTLSGYEVSAAHDGRQGLAAVAERRPHLILLDVRMPVMDGLTMLTKLRENEATRQIPVIMVSASHDDRQRALELGAYFFIEKPYDPNVLRVTIAAVLQKPAPKECVQV
jgi:hypothetical protein